MSFINKLKDKINETEPAFVVVTQEIKQPIHLLDINHLIDANDVTEKCLSLQAGNNNRPDIVKKGWQSKYFDKRKDTVPQEQFNTFSTLINLIEEKTNKLMGQNLYEVSEFWVVVYNIGSKQLFHNHILEKPHLKFVTSLTAVYYPKCSEESSPLEFKNSYGANLSVKVSTGQLIIFPSSAVHGVPENKDNEIRVAVSFNLNLKSSYINI